MVLVGWLKAGTGVAFLLLGTTLSSAQVVPKTPNVAVVLPFGATCLYVAPEDFGRWRASLTATLRVGSVERR